MDEHGLFFMNHWPLRGKINPSVDKLLTPAGSYICYV